MNGIDMRRIRVAEDWTLTVAGLVLVALLLTGVLGCHRPTTRADLGLSVQVGQITRYVQDRRVRRRSRRGARRTRPW